MKLSHPANPTSPHDHRLAGTNGFCERFHRTVKEEFYAVTFRRTFYESPEQLQRHLDAYLAFYKRERAHQGYRTQARTPFQTFSEGLNNCAERR